MAADVAVKAIDANVMEAGTIVFLNPEGNSTKFQRIDRDNELGVTPTDTVLYNRLQARMDNKGYY